MHGGWSRRSFLRRAAAATAWIASACVSGPPSISASPAPTARQSGASGTPPLEGTLRILQGTHPIAAFDAYLDRWALSWGTTHGVTVRIDRIPAADVPVRAAAEATAKAGHDIIAFVTSGLAASYAASLVDITDVCDRAAGRYGGWIAQGTALGMAQGKWYAYPDHCAPSVSIWRPDLWSRAGFGSDHVASWSEIADRAAALKAVDRPIGTSLGLNIQAEHTWRSLLWSHGGAEFSADGKTVAIDSPETRSALGFAKALTAAMEPAVQRWNDLDPAAHLRSGRGSWIHDSLAAYRAVEAAEPNVARAISLDPTPAGPKDRLGSFAFSEYGIWNFSPNIAAARQLLIDYSDDWPAQFAASTGYNLPFLNGRLAKPMPVLGADAKLAPLQDVTRSMRPIGHPGPPTRAAFDALSQRVLSTMFADYCTGTRTLDQTIADAARRLGDSLTRFPP